MKNKAGIALIILGVITILVGIIKIISVLSNVASQTAEISVIGGADGPTTIFLAGKLGTSLGIMLFAGLIFLIIGIILFNFKGRTH